MPDEVTWAAFAPRLHEILRNLPGASRLDLIPSAADATGWIQIECAHPARDLLVSCRDTHDPAQEQRRLRAGWTKKPSDEVWIRQLTWPATSTQYDAEVNAVIEVLRETATGPSELTYECTLDPSLTNDPRMRFELFHKDPAACTVCLPDLGIPTVSSDW